MTERVQRVRRRHFMIALRANVVRRARWRDIARRTSTHNIRRATALFDGRNRLKTTTKNHGIVKIRCEPSSPGVVINTERRETPFAFGSAGKRLSMVSELSVDRLDRPGQSKTIEIVRPVVR